MIELDSVGFQKMKNSLKLKKSMWDLWKKEYLDDRISYMEKKEKIKKKVKVQRRWFLKNFLKIFFVMWAIFKAFIDRVEREVGGGDRDGEYM